MYVCMYVDIDRYGPTVSTSGNLTTGDLPRCCDKFVCYINGAEAGNDMSMLPSCFTTCGSVVPGTFSICASMS